MNNEQSHVACNVGICAVELIIPLQYVDQKELEIYDGVSAGKYTIGLGQQQMGFCSDCEDINSLCLSALSKLVEKCGISYSDIGRLDVGTETIVDKSKSVKTVLMDLFKESKNFNVEGLDTTNACYGGTAALFNACSWMESSAWDGRFAVVIAGDIAVYAEGNARPTGGAGAVAMLIGPNAPLVLEQRCRGTYMVNVYDFYKPDLSSEYPYVDGTLSVRCYLNALDNCYKGYREKAKQPSLINLNKFDAFVFHSPYYKLVQKSLARLFLNDFVYSCQEKGSGDYSPQMSHLVNVKLEDTYFDKDVEKICVGESKALFEKMTAKSLLIPSRVGNMYTASVFSSLVSYLASFSHMNGLIGQKIGVFSYGSGLASSMYSFVVRDSPYLDSMLQSAQNAVNRLDERIKVSPQQFSLVLKQREQVAHSPPLPYKPHSLRESDVPVFPGCWYLQEIDERYRRSYCRK